MVFYSVKKECASEMCGFTGQGVRLEINLIPFGVTALLKKSTQQGVLGNKKQTLVESK
ncbi:hypothetical protein HOLleu_36608 [Holothuria leucospilota]|uniref:Uncharacterized protein n=1 Tax=Holothuria leucospilota TaxID=206669 RepID=A0A9Q0YKA8_HOLLE|nr:hypothetical protein HOLleu_36608 [Holothuria leucospilota]